MLLDLHIRNLAVLESAAVEFGPGLNILSGETGAGKSIVVDSLALLAGARASSDLIRHGADLLTVSGVFEEVPAAVDERLAESGVERDGDALVIRREVSREGRNRVFINDQPVTLKLLAEVAPWLLRIHAQREELGLTSAEQQRRWLDKSGGDKAAALLARVAERYAEYRTLEQRLERLTGDERLRLERVDLLKFQAGEIDGAALTEGEEEELSRQRDELRNSEAISTALGSAQAALLEDDESAVERVARSAQQLSGIGEWVGEAAGWVGELDEARIRLQEVAAAVQERLQAVRADPQQLNALEDRLATLERLFRKYGQSTAEVLELRRRIGAELEELEGDEQQRDELEAAAQAALAAYREAAVKLSRQRGKWGEALAERIHAELGELAMGKARFSVTLEPRGREHSPLRLAGRGVEFTAAGLDRVEFSLCANPGEETRALARVASGGELSRVYLALQLAVRGEGEAAAATMVFDEVDAGIGGAEAAALGRKLKRLAGGGQILAVTHLPQVASHADRHFKLSKRTRGERTKVEVERLSEELRVEEVARMLAGKQVTELSREHAEELIAVAERREG